VQTFDLKKGATATVIDPDPASSTQTRLLATTDAIFITKTGAKGYTIDMFDLENLDMPAQTWAITDDSASESTPLPVPQFSGNTLIVSTKHGAIYIIGSQSPATPDRATPEPTIPTHIEKSTEKKGDQM
jgi:hypothetical protein